MTTGTFIYMPNHMQQMLRGNHCRIEHVHIDPTDSNAHSNALSLGGLDSHLHVVFAGNLQDLHRPLKSQEESLMC